MRDETIREAEKNTDIDFPLQWACPCACTLVLKHIEKEMAERSNKLSKTLLLY
jgi:hypothetical protein